MTPEDKVKIRKIQLDINAIFIRLNKLEARRTEGDKS